MPVNPGRLRDRLTLQDRTVIDTPGGTEDVWTTVSASWARVVQVGALGASRYQQAGYTNVTHEVVMRADATVTLAGSRFLWGARVLEVLAPPHDAAQTGRFMTIACREVTDATAIPNHEQSSSS